jgi:hypothetical protein
MAEVYVSTDVETDGPIPGPHSLLSLGSAAYSEAGEPLGTFTANLHTLPGAAGHPDTMAWWATQPAAWAACREDPRDPAEAMTAYAAWLDALPGKPVCVAYPAGFDFTFVYWYLVRFAGRSPFGFSCLDLKSFAMAVLGTSFRGTSKRNMPKDWFDGRPHPHVALADAVGQGELFMRMRQAARRG